MAMGLLVGFIFAATLSGADPWPEPCGGLQRKVAQGARALYLDPSDANRKAITKQLVDQLPDPTRSSSVGCWETIAGHLMLFADEDILLAAIEEKYAAVDRALKKASPDGPGKSVAAAMEVLRRFRRRFPEVMAERPNARRSSAVLPKTRSDSDADLDERCRREWDLAAFPCEARLEPLVRSGATTSRALLERFIQLESKGRKPYFEAWRAWLDLFDRYPNRSDRLRVALRANGTRAWALDELVGGFDPRAWDPADVAIVVAAIHEFDEPTPPHVDRIQPSPSDMEGYGGSSEIMQSLRALVPMGAIRTFDLVQPRMRIGGINVPARFDAPGRSFFGATAAGHVWEHSCDELLLYLDRAEDRTTSLDVHVENHWRETDLAAPHPDIDAVKRELTKLENAEKARKP